MPALKGADLIQGTANQTRLDLLLDRLLGMLIMLSVHQHGAFARRGVCSSDVLVFAGLDSHM
jgi:hypothetical protein